MGRWSGKYRPAVMFTAIVAAHMASPSPSAAQVYPLPSEQPEARTCKVFAGAAADGMQEVRARCWGTGLTLGQADRFQAFENAELRSTVVELVRDGERRVLLLRPFAGDQPLAEDITGALANAAGRVSWAGVEGLTLDFEGFVSTGAIGVAPEARADLRTDGRAVGATASTVGASEVRIDRYIALDETRMAAAEGR